jgi:hypothetical protein
MKSKKNSLHFTEKRVAILGPGRTRFSMAIAGVFGDRSYNVLLRKE